MRVFADFRYTDQLEAGADVHALVFRADVGDREVEGIDLVRVNADGLIDDFTVFVRPLSGLNALAARWPRRWARPRPRLRDRGYLGLGSNVGDRRANLERGVELLPARGVDGARVVVDLRHRPGGRGARPARLPQRLHPRSRPSWGPRRCWTPARTSSASSAATSRAASATAPRPIDVDLLLLGDRAHRRERLTLPHAQVLARRFVLIPLLELDMDLARAGGERLADALAQLPVDEGVRRAGPPLAVSAAR